MKRLAGFALSLSLAFAAGVVQASDLAEGEWVTAGGKGRVKIGLCADDATRLCGRIIWIYKDHADARNPDVRLRGRPIVGIQFLSNFRNVGPGRWTGGTIYDPESGKTYQSLMAVRPNNALEVKGCVLMFCQAQIWTRAR